MKCMNRFFINACGILDNRLKDILLRMNTEFQNVITEISIHKNGSVFMTYPHGILFIDAHGNILNHLPIQPYFVNEKCFEEIIMSACGQSLYAHNHELKNGYISFAAGCRVALAGINYEKSQGITDYRSIDSLNIRIARDINVPVDQLVCCGKDVRSALIIGQPASGKTTVLRSIVRTLANGDWGKYYRVCVIDERNEILPVGLNRPIAANVISGMSKHEAIQRAVRLCSPDVVVCDEIGTIEEAVKMKDAVLSGVIFICSMHASSFAEVYKKECFQLLQNNSVFENLVLLKGRESPGEIDLMINTKDISHEVSLSSCC